MKRLLAGAMVACLMTAADNGVRVPPEKLQGRWMYSSSPGEIYEFKGDQFTHIREAHTGQRIIDLGRRGRYTTPKFHVPRAESQRTFRLDGTKTPNVIVLCRDDAKGQAETELIFELLDEDTLKIERVRGFGETHYATLKREPHASP